MSKQNDSLKDLFRSEGRRLTSQRRLVLRALHESETHLDAEALHDRVKTRDPDISLATVYRTLTVFKEMGLVEEHHLGEEHSHYEAARSGPHHHFICLRCGEVTEFDAPLVTQIVRKLVKQEEILVTDVHLRLSGYCARCQGEAGRQDTFEEIVKERPGDLALPVQ